MLAKRKNTARRRGKCTLKAALKGFPNWKLIQAMQGDANELSEFSEACGKEAKSRGIA